MSLDWKTPALGGIRLVLGGNVFGWTADHKTSFAILDAFLEAGGRMVDTADMYSAWVPGHKGGESETVLGAWMKARGNRTSMRIATKLNGANQPGGLAPEKIAASLEEAKSGTPGIPHAEVESWVNSWDTPNELPRPEAHP